MKCKQRYFRIILSRVIEKILDMKKRYYKTDLLEEDDY